MTKADDDADPQLRTVAKARARLPPEETSLPNFPSPNHDARTPFPHLNTNFSGATTFADHMKHNYLSHKH